MATIVIPVPIDQPSFRQVVPLDGLNYILDLRWSERANGWFLDLFDDAEDPIRTGIRLVANWNLLRLIADERVPRGVLMALASGGDADPTFETLGTEVSLVYVEPSGE